MGDKQLQTYFRQIERVAEGYSPHYPGFCGVLPTAGKMFARAVYVSDKSCFVFILNRAI